jgi:large subunit ribosomal protein L33
MREIWHANVLGVGLDFSSRADLTSSLLKIAPPLKILHQYFSPLWASLRSQQRHSSPTMHATTVLNMARGKGKTIPIKLISSAGTGFFYTTRKNVTRTPEKLALLKLDPIVRRRVIFKEGKIK